jgi:hypothetical protein
MRALDAAFETPPVDPAVLVAFVLAGGALGATYAAGTRVLTGEGPRLGERLGRSTE